jgi:hypothetical protein
MEYRFNGWSGKGFMKTYRLRKRLAAEARNADYRLRVAATMEAHGISEKEAKRVVQAVSAVNRRKREIGLGLPGFETNE